MDATSFFSVAFNNLHNRELEEGHEEWSSHQIIFRNSVIRNLGRSLEARDATIVANCSAPLINWLFQHSAERNSVHLRWNLFLCAADKEGLSTRKRCFLVSFTDGVGEKERNSTKNQPVKLIRFILLTRKAVLHCSSCSSLSLSIYNCLPLQLAIYLFLVVDHKSTYIIMRRMYLPTKTSHKTYASLVNYQKSRNVHLKDNYLLRDVKFGDNVSHSQKAHC